MTINLIVNENNIITGWQSYPIIDTLPLVSVDDPSTIRIGYDRYIDGAIVPDDAAYAAGQAKATAFTRILDLKAQLAATDYKLFKYMEGELTADEYAETKAERQAWRDEINQLQETYDL